MQIPSDALKHIYSHKSEKVLLEDKKSVFYVIPKNGCTTIKTFFSKYYGWNIVGNAHNVQSEIYQHIVNSDIAKTSYKSFYKFAFIRDPFSRLYSAYKSKIFPNLDLPHLIDGVERGLYNMGIRKNHTFEQFVDIIYDTDNLFLDPHVKPQFCFLLNTDGEIVVDEIFLFSDFKSEFERCLKKIGAFDNSTLIPHENKTVRLENEYKQHFSEKMIYKVEEKYKIDLVLLSNIIDKKAAY